MTSTLTINKSLAQEFYLTFQNTRADITTRLDTLKQSNPVAQDVIQAIAIEIAKLRKDLIDAHVFLPGYDQRQYEQSLKTLEEGLQQLRASSAPKSKFSFKRSTAKASSSVVITTTPALPSTTPTVPAQITPSAPSNNLTLTKKTDTYLTWSSLPTTSLSLSSTDITISELEGCVVNLLPSTSTTTPSITALHVWKLNDTVLILPTVGGSALLHDLNRCTIVLGCHQFRMHTSTDVDVYLSIESNPIIEHSSRIRFAPYPQALYVNTPIDPDKSKHLSVQDFSHIRATPSPNWSARLPEGISEPGNLDWLSLAVNLEILESPLRDAVVRDVLQGSLPPSLAK